MNFYRTVQAVGTTLLFYDHLLTFKDEVRCFWLRRMSGVTVIFVVLRYGNLLCFVFGAASASPIQDDNACRVLNTLAIAMQVLTFAGLGLFCSLRVYAVTRKSKVLLALVAALMTIFVVFQLYTSVWGVHVYSQLLPYHGCYTSIEPSVAKMNQMLYAYSCTYRYSAHRAFVANVGMGVGLAGELVVQLATWRATFRLARSLRRLKMPHKLSTLLLRDGTFMFCFLSIWLVTSESVTLEQDLSSISTMVISLTVCRFILRLQQVYLPADLTADTSLSNMGFSFVTGNIGASELLHFNGEDDEDDPDP